MMRGATALDIARENGNEQALKTISTAMQKSVPN
jgi:hypothetical protein